jgi:hypothetical protein
VNTFQSHLNSFLVWILLVTPLLAACGVAGIGDTCPSSPTAAAQGIQRAFISNNQGDALRYFHPDERGALNEVFEGAYEDTARWVVDQSQDTAGRQIIQLDTVVYMTIRIGIIWNYYLNGVLVSSSKEEYTIVLPAVRHRGCWYISTKDTYEDDLEAFRSPPTSTPRHPPTPTAPLVHFSPSDISRNAILLYADRWEPGEKNQHIDRHVLGNNPVDPEESWDDLFQARGYDKSVQADQELLYDEMIWDTIQNGRMFYHKLDRSWPTPRIGFYHRKYNILVAVDPQRRIVVTAFRPKSWEDYYSGLQEKGYYELIEPEVVGP